ncbi:MAG: ABC transporter ATP-binding protein [Clostridia bacterium]|nr:ABC transporter ATP-binding protein [Clostridia bacterium]
MNNDRRPIVTAGPGGPGRGGPMGGRMNAQKPKNLGKTVGRLMTYIGKSRLLVIVLLISVLFTTVFDLAGPWLQGEAINTIHFSEIINDDGSISSIFDFVDFELMLKILAAMAVVYVLNSIINYVMGVLSAKLSQATVFSLRNDLFKKISRLPIKYTDTHRHGDIMSRMTNDVENVSNAISQSLSSLFTCIITLLGAGVLMLGISWQMTLIALVTVPLTVLTSTGLAKLMRRYYVKQQRLLGELNSHIEEMVTGYKTVVSYGKEPEQVEKFTRLSGELKKAGIKAGALGGVMGPCMNIIGNLQYLLIAVFGGVFAIRGAFDVGSIQKLLGYSKKFTRPINQIANLYSQILTALAGAERIFEIMDSAVETDEGDTEIDVESIKGYIEFKDIRFGYNPNEPVLKGLNLSVKPGQKIAIVGATGSGKTTIVNLLTRFYDLDGGSITVDGIDINTIPKSTLRKMIAIVLQDTVLFSDTIERNIKYGRLEATDEEMREAARASKADIFIERLPNGYQTMLTESGSNLSQGQRQLLSISRAVLADPKILILDEATSSVDTRTEMHIQQAMVSLMKNRTSLIIAHRLSTIIDADVIVVLKNGVIAEAGNHEELLARKGEYFKLYNTQYAGIAT